VEAEEEEVVVEKPLLRWPLLLLRKKLRRLPLLLTCSAAEETAETIKQYESKIKEYVNAYNLVSMRHLPEI